MNFDEEYNEHCGAKCSDCNQCVFPDKVEDVDECKECTKCGSC